MTYDSAQEGYIQNGFTPTTEPQLLPVKAAMAKGKMSALDAQHAKLVPLPTVMQVTVDGMPALASVPNGSVAAAQQATDQDLRLMGEEPLKFEACEVPGCKGEGRHEIRSGAGKPLSINSKGELVFHDVEPVHHYGMTASDKARAQAQALADVTGGQVIDLRIGPSGQVARQAPKVHVNVCQIHQWLPHAPKEPKKQYASGPWSSYVVASARAHEVGLRAPGSAVQVISEQSRFAVQGDDGIDLPRGIKLTEIK